MNAQPTNWMQGLLALGFGLVASVAFVFFAKRMFKPTVLNEGTADDLQARYATLIGQLKEHAQAKHLMTAEQWAAEEQRLSCEAAALLRERDNASHAEVKAKARAEKKAKQELASPPSNPVVKIGGWVAIAVIFVVVVAIVLSKEAKDRKDEPQQEPTATEREATAEEIAQLKAVLDTAQKNPDDVDALSNASWALIRNRRFEDAAQIISRASFLDPYHVQTRVHRAILDAAQGNDTEALTELEHLTQTYSDTGEAHLYAGTLSMGLRDPARALAHFDRYLAQVPVSQQPPTLKASVEKLRAQLSQR
jgi:tetratricopeptide (TPR) repeat protein